MLLVMQQDERALLATIDAEEAKQDDAPSAQP